MSDSRPDQPLKIGLTGGIASGKSTVADMFADLGVPIIDTDVIARELVLPGQPALEDIRRRFGDDVIDHYTRAAEWEQEEFDRAVTDWEIARGFEKA